MENNYQTRLLIEFKQLVERRYILERTLNEETCQSMDSKQLELARKQFEFMFGYEEILFQRIVTMMK